jgi:hypothetical protein
LCIWPKDWSFLLQILPRKVHLRAIGGAFYRFVDSSITMAISAYGKVCLYC